MFSYKYALHNYLHIKKDHIPCESRALYKNEMSSDSWEQQTKETAADRTAPEHNTKQHKLKTKT